MITKINQNSSLSMQTKSVLSKAWASPAALFYSATLISSIGSMTYLGSLVGFMSRAGYSLAVIGFLIGSCRLVPILINLLFGQISDQMSPRKLVVLTEILSLLFTGGMFVSWNLGKEYFSLFFIFSILRAIFGALQFGARAKITKALSDDSYQQNAKHATWLNKATQGATLFGGVLSFAGLSYLDFTWAILFDAITFAISGVLIVMAKTPESVENSEKISLNPQILMHGVTKKFSDLYHYAWQPALLDLLLAIAICGTAALMARFAGGVEQYVPLFFISYGAAVWVSGYLERLPIVQNHHALIWFVLGASFLAISFSVGNIALALSFSFIKDICYWILFHRYSTKIQMQTPQAVIAGVSAARVVQMIVALSLGEMGVGFLQKYAPVTVEGLWRFVFCAIVSVAIVWMLTARHKHPKI